MPDHKTHASHKHVHQSGCGHKSIRHGDHSDYLHDGHMHRLHGDHVDECSISVDASNPAPCTPAHSCAGHKQDHAHYLVGGHLHHSHSNHCDDHGVVQAV